MKKISLKDYVSQHSQDAAARLLGRHQTNIGLMLRKSDRTFTLYFDDNDEFVRCIEEKIYAEASVS